MADGVTSGDQSFSNKTILPPIGKGGGDVSEQKDCGRTKIKVRPAKLKTPLDQVLSTGGAVGGAYHHRPIGTPPPTSLRKPSLHGEPTTGQAFATSPDHFGFFPKINVENCLELGYDDDDDQSPVLLNSPSRELTTQPDNRQVQPSSAENNNGSGRGVDSNAGGLTPPTRLVTRDQDGVVFELTSGQSRGQPGGKQSPLTPTKKITRLEPILK